MSQFAFPNELEVFGFFLKIKFYSILEFFGVSLKQRDPITHKF